MDAIVRHAGDGRATWMLNGLIVTKAERSQTGGAYGLTEHVVTRNSVPPMHLHHMEEEAFYLLEGEIDFEVEGEVIHAVTGSFAFIPRGAAHRFTVVSETARMLVIASAPGGEPPNGGLASFYDTIGEATPEHVLPVPSSPNPAGLLPIAADHGITILPPGSSGD